MKPCKIIWWLGWAIASFKLMCVSPDNLKIDKHISEKWKIQNGVWRRITGFQNASWREIDVLDVNFSMPGSKIWNIIEKRPKNTKTYSILKVDIFFDYERFLMNMLDMDFKHGFYHEFYYDFNMDMNIILIWILIWF